MRAFEARQPTDFARVFAAMADQQVSALMIHEDTMLNANANALAIFAAVRRLPSRIGALVAHREECGWWTVDALGAPHVGERSEKELISSFVDKIAALSPQLVTFNGSFFDLPVLRYRAMVHGATGTPKMRLIYAMCCPRSVLRPRRAYMNCAG
jgi:hypothetical protein